MDIKAKIEELKAHRDALSDRIESDKKDMNKANLIIRRLEKHLEKADEILNGKKIVTPQF